MFCRLGGTSVEQYWKTKLDNLQADMTYLEKKQAQLDREQQLVDKEDELSQRLVNIESYEQEVIKWSVNIKKYKRKATAIGQFGKTQIGAKKVLV